MLLFKKVIHVFLIFQAWFTLFTFKAEGQVGFPYCETFQNNSTQASTVFGGSASLAGEVPRLTSNERNQSGFVFIDIPFSSVFGIKTTFEYFSYGGSRCLPV